MVMNPLLVCFKAVSHGKIIGTWDVPYRQGFSPQSAIFIILSDWTVLSWHFITNVKKGKVTLSILQKSFYNPFPASVI